MSSFNLEEALKNWRAELRKQQGLEPGYIEEIESNLLDRYEDYIENGIPEAEAFAKAVEKSVSTPEEVADEFFKARTPIAHKTPPWKKNAKWVELLPSYLKVALRSFQRKKGYTIINYIGLTVGLLTICFVGLYIHYEVTWDTFHSKSDRTYRVGQLYRSQEYSLNSFDGFFSSTREAQLSQVEGFKSIPGVEDVAHFWVFSGASYLNFDNRRFKQEGLLSTNTPKAFFNIFDWQFIYGNSTDFSSSPGHAVLTKSTALKLNNNPKSNVGNLVGQTITIDSVDYEVAGIIENIPSNSHYDFEIALHDERIEYWGARTYALLSEDADIEDVRTHWNSSIAEINPQLAQQGELFRGFQVHNLENIHLEANALYEIKPPGDKRYLLIFGIIGGVILLITFTNYTNLSIAMYSGRNREIGMRKVMGAGGSQIAGQFLLESVLISILTIPIVLILLWYLLPYFNQFMGVDIQNLFFTSALFSAGLLSTAILLGLTSGLYPAFSLSSKKIRNLFDKQLSKPATRGFSLRKGLITFQFTLLIGLGSATWLINDQLDFVNNKDIGYNKEGVVYVMLDDSASHAGFSQLLSSSSVINEVGKGSPLASRTYNQTTYSIDGHQEVFDDGYLLSMTPSALSAYGINTSLDSYFENKENTPERLMLINNSGAEKFATILGIKKEKLIGRTFRTDPEYIQEDGTVGLPYQIDGFFDDINMFSLKEEIDPYFLLIGNDIWAQWSIVNFNTTNISGAMTEIEQAYNKLNQMYPLTTQFQEDRLKELYEQDQRVASLTIYLSCLAFIVALLGLVALSAYLTSIREKEIGVRKILGANDFQLVYHLNKEYFYLVGISMLIASPIAYYGIQQWLSNFAYRIDINPLVFLFFSIITLSITALAVSSQTIKASNSNPVDTLRNEQ